MSVVRLGAVGAATALLGTLGLPGWEATSEQAAQDETARYQVANVQVVHRVTAGSAVVAVRLYLLGGTRQLTAETAGIEALLLRAITLERGRAMARTGSRTILEFGPDWSVIGFVGLRDDVDSTWAALARLLAGPPQSEDAIGQARGELLTAARRRHTQPDLHVQAIARRAAFRGHPYALDPEGTEQSLDALTQADLERYWEDQVVTSRMVLVVVGDVSRAQVASLVQGALDGLPAGNYTWSLPPPVEPRPSAWSIEYRALPTNYILGYFTGPDPGHRDYFPFRAAVALLSSQLTLEVRERESLSYTTYAPFLDRARPVGGVYSSTSDPSMALGIMRDEIEDLAEARFLDATWRGFLDQFTLDQLLQRMTSDGQAEALARAHLYFDDLEMADRYVDRLRRVNLSAVRRVAERYFGTIQYAFLGDTMQMGGKW